MNLLKLLENQKPSNCETGYNTAMTQNKIFILVSTTILGLAFLLAIFQLPLSKETRLLVTSNQTLESHLLLPGQTIQQTYIAKNTKQSGIQIFTTAQSLTNQRLKVTVHNQQDNKILAHGKLTSQSYLPADDTIIQNYSFRWIKTTPKQPLSISIQLVEGKSLPLRISIKNTYKQGNLYINEVRQKSDLALATIHPTNVSFGTKTGATFGVVFLIATTVILTIVPHKFRWLSSALLLIFITPLSLLGFWFSSGVLGIADWDLYFSYHEVVRRTILTFHTFPFWNPWLCGGTAGLADPEFPFFTFTFLLELIFGIPAGLRLAIYLSIATTATGMLTLARRLRLSLPAALLTALAGAFGSVSILEIVEGHPNVFAAMWIPWIFWAWLTAYRYNQAETNKIKKTVGRKRSINIWHLICGAFLALAFYAGGIYLLMYTSLAFILLNFLVKYPASALRTTITSGLWALGLASIKIIPVLIWLRQFPDKSYASSAATFSFLNEILFGRHLHGSNIIFNQTSGWHEYGAYIGYFVFALALIGISQYKKNRIVQSLTISALAAILLSSAGPTLKPYFDQIPFFPRSNISRFILFAIIPLSLLAGYGLDILTKKITSHNNLVRFLHIKAILPIIILGVVAIDLFSLSYQLSEQAFVLPDVAIKPELAKAPIAYTTQRFDPNGSESRTTRSYVAIKRGYGTLTYCSVLGPDPMIRTIYDEVDNGIILAKPKPENIKLISWDPNRAIFKLKNSEPTILILNANYAKGWQVNDKPAFNDSGRVATKVQPGENTVTFEFKTAGLPLGLLITITTLILAILTIRNNIKRKSK